MTTKPNPSVTSTSVAERRLRPIYDWLDNGNNKKALQEAEKVLRKQPELTCAKVLMALAQIRLGRESDAQGHLETVLSEAPTDDAVLQAMTIAFRELQKPEKICQMYENATKKEPMNEELLSHLFISYVRMSQYKKQQQAALQLYKAKAKNPYYFWAVMSIVLQAMSCEEESTAIKVMLPLAERMISKMEKEGKIEQEQETQLYLLVLEMQHKFREALQVLKGPLGIRLEEHTSFIDLVPRKRLLYLRQLGEWEKVNSLAKELLKRRPDQWAEYLDYLMSVFRLAESEPKNHPETVDATVIQASRFLTSQQEENQTCRGPYLAEMELCVRVLESPGELTSTYSKDALLRLLETYFKMFGSKPSCFGDIKKYLSKLEQSQKAPFLESALATITFGANKEPETVQHIQRHICWYEMQRFLGMQHVMSTDEIHQLIEELQRVFEATQHLTKDCPNTEQRANDTYIILASHLLWDRWTESSNDDYFWKAVVLLEYALKLSPANYQIRLVLIKFYNQVGAVGAAHTVYSGLEVKHVQLDSLGHLLTRHLITSGHFSTASSVIASTLKFFSGNYKDIVDHIISAYRCGSFAQIQEFIKLRDRLSVSQHYTCLTVESMLLYLMYDMSSHEEAVKIVSFFEVDPKKNEIEWNKLVDNRDLKTMASWDPLERALSENAIVESFLDEQKLVHLRGLMLKAVATALYISDEDIYESREFRKSAYADSLSMSNGVKGGSDMPQVLKNLTDELAQTVSELNSAYREKAVTDFSRPLQNPGRPRILLFLRDRCSDAVVMLLRLVMQIHSITQSDPDQLKSEECAQHFTATSSFLETIITAVDSRFKEDKGQSMTCRNEQLETLVNATEACSFTTYFYGICSSMLRPFSKGIAGKKNKKRKEIKPELTKLFSEFNNTLKAVDNHIESLLSIIEDMAQVIELDKLSASMQHKFSQILLLEESCQVEIEPAHSIAMDALQEDIAKYLDSSYQFSFWQFKTVLKKKREYLQGLRL